MKNIAIALLCAATSACTFVSSFVSGAESAAGATLGARAAGQAVGTGPSGSTGAQPAVAHDGGETMPAMYANPAYLNMYMSLIFTYAFSSGGYDVSPAEYKTGEYTRWSGSGENGKKILVERAHLSDDAQGRQWWKVKWTDESQKTIVLEGLLSPTEKRFVRMRARFPEDAEGKELPVDQSTSYHAPQRLSPESIEGATKGVESVTVPAGTFKAKHVVFGGMDGTHEWWMDSKVPGGTVRQALKSPNDEKSRWNMELAAYGSDAKSELGSK